VLALEARCNNFLQPKVGASLTPAAFKFAWHKPCLNGILNLL
jgi:hypothetical protein